MYLANYLFSEYGVVQNIAGHWDESSGVMIDDHTIEFVENEFDAGFTVSPRCSGADPVGVIDYGITMSMYNGRMPFFVSDKIKLDFIRQGYLFGIDTARYNNALAASEAGNDVESSRQIILGLAERGQLDETVTMSPLQYTQQNPWREPIDYSTDIEKLLLAEDIEFKIAPNSSISIDLMVGPSNTLSLNIPAKRVRRIYDMIDGYVSHDIIKSSRETPLQRGNKTYHLAYVNNAGGNVLMKRDIAIDLEVYPSRVSYPTNNIIRELLSPIREDAHSKKMDGRSVFVRFDTRYISESVHSYYEKFLEAPTAFTCDQLPEEAILNRIYYEDETLFNDSLDYIDGDDIVQKGGEVHLRFDNDTDEEQTLKLSYSNTRVWAFLSDARGYGAMKADDIFKLFSADLMFRGYDEEISTGRIKNGTRLVGTIEGD
jgi:hypothetical protein